MKLWIQQYGTLFLLLAFALGLGTFVFRGQHLNKNEEQSIAIMEELKQQLEATLANPSAIQTTLQLNTNRFSCLSSGADACKNKGGAFILYSLPTREPIPFSQIAQDRGLSTTKASCSKFPSPNCPLRIETSWYPMGDNERCDLTHPIMVSARIILNNGTFFLDWKTEKIIPTKVSLNAQAQCSCQGKQYLAGECRGIASAPAAENYTENEQDPDAERELARQRENEEHAEFRLADCPTEIDFRGEKIAVPFMGPNGETQIEVNGDDSRCTTSDIYRYSCTPRMNNGKAIPQWTLTGVEKGSCEKEINAAITTNTTIEENTTPRQPANSLDQETNIAIPNNSLEIRQGFVPEERIEQ